MALPIVNIAARSQWEVNATTRRFTSERQSVPILLKAGWSSRPMRTATENYCPTGVQPRTVHHRASPY